MVARRNGNGNGSSGSGRAAPLHFAISACMGRPGRDVAIGPNVALIGLLSLSVTPKFAASMNAVGCHF
jgi:hypothetical protein